MTSKLLDLNFLAVRTTCARASLFLALPVAALLPVASAMAQTAGASNDSNTDQEVSDFHDAMEDAAMATGGASPVPQTNLFATAPAQEQPAPRQPFTANILVSAWWNSNANESNNHPIGTLDWKADARLTYTTNVIPELRLSVQARVDTEQYTEYNRRNINFTRQNVRFQYVNPNDDQAFSPFVAFAPRQDYQPFYADLISYREDLNVGVQKRFNFDASFRQLPAASRTGSDTVWSLGFTLFGQQRWRWPFTNSNALVFAPSIGYKINSDWDVSLAGELTRRWFESSNNRQRADVLIEPILTLAYSIPSSMLGSNSPFGAPVIEAQVATESLLSNQTNRNFSAVYAGLTFRSGWRF